LSLHITKYHAVKTYRGVETHLHAFLTSTLNGSNWSASYIGHLTPGKSLSSTHWIGGWLDPRAGLDATVKRKKSLPFSCLESNPGHPAHDLVTILTELPQMHEISYTTQLFWYFTNLILFKLGILSYGNAEQQSKVAKRRDGSRFTGNSRNKITSATMRCMLQIVIFNLCLMDSGKVSE
jgi:hypothetical protein